MPLESKDMPGNDQSKGKVRSSNPQVTESLCLYITWCRREMYGYVDRLGAEVAPGLPVLHDWVFSVRPHTKRCSQEGK